MKAEGYAPLAKLVAVPETKQDEGYFYTVIFINIIFLNKIFLNNFIVKINKSTVCG